MSNDVTGMKKYLLHLHPIKIDKRALKFTRTFGLGIIAVVLLTVLTVTGMILRFSYVPTPAEAYDSIVQLEQGSMFGRMMRSLHHISGKLLVVVSFLHFLRVIYSQALYGSRAKNWIYGLIMMGMVFMASFTGYLLPWDQLAYWAVTVVTGIVEYIPHHGHQLANLIRGGETVNGNTLLTFYNLHTGIIPIAFTILTTMHFWLVRKAGMIALPKTADKEAKEKVDVETELIPREIMIGMITLAILLVIAVFYSAPLLAEANPAKSPNPSKAPWYFLGAQELLLHLDPIFGALIVPLLVVSLFFFLPYLVKQEQVRSGEWFHSPLGKKITFHSIWISKVFTFGLILLLDYVLHFETLFPSLPMWISTGIFPILLYTIPLSAVLFYWKTKAKANTIELLLGVVTMLLTSYVVMMLVSIFLRGEGMQLIF